MDRQIKLIKERLNKHMILITLFVLPLIK